MVKEGLVPVAVSKVHGLQLLEHALLRQVKFVAEEKLNILGAVVSVIFGIEQFFLLFI